MDEEMAERKIILSSLGSIISFYFTFANYGFGFHYIHTLLFIFKTFSSEKMHRQKLKKPRRK